MYVEVKVMERLLGDKLWGDDCDVSLATRTQDEFCVMMLTNVGIVKVKDKGMINLEYRLDSLERDIRYLGDVEVLYRLGTKGEVG